MLLTFDKYILVLLLFRNTMIKKIKERKQSITLLIALSLGMFSSISFAQSSASSATLDKIRSTGTIVIGHRSGSIPISYSDEQRKPLGYGVEICNRIAQRVRDSLGMPNLNIQYQEVTPSNRIDLVTSGKIDLECGSTTNNAERRARVDFSIPYYVAGIRILTRADSDIKSFSDLKGKTVTFGKGTTAINIVNKLNKERDMKIKINEAPDFDAALQTVVQKTADAFILDDLLLYGARSKINNPESLVIVGDFLSIEPIAIAMRKNDRIKAIADKELYSLMITGEINNIYRKWFESPIPPKGNVLNIPQSGLLKDIFRMPIDIVGD